jgi:hypothetical protein
LAMAAFHKAWPNYDADNDEQDELGDAISDQQFSIPSSIASPRSADTMWPPCENEDNDVE